MGPLKGVRIVEMGGIGPAPFGAMMLADMGADIIRIDRRGSSLEFYEPKYELLNRGRRSIILDLKKSGATDVALRIVNKADGLIEGFRPGVMERLGLGPDVCLDQNPRLVYCRITGWGQEGPLAQAAGHDINYLSITGALHSIGPQGEKPIPPLNLVGDFSGGGMLIAFGMVCALFEAQESGKGQVIDAAMVDGVSALMTTIVGFKAAQQWSDERGTNMWDGGAHFYNTYETADGKWISLASVEPPFYKLLLELAEIDDPDFLDQFDKAKWPVLKEKIAVVFKKKTIDEWCKIMEGTDVCFAPVLTIGEAMEYPHNVAREAFIEVEGIKQPAPAPRFSRTKPQIQRPPASPGEHTEEALSDWGFTPDEIASLEKAEII